MRKGKVLLVDVLNSGSRGALSLDRYLIGALQKKTQVRILDKLPPSRLQSSLKKTGVNAMLGRNKVLQENEQNAYGLICLGSVPPGVRLNIPVTVSIQNLFMATNLYDHAKSREQQLLLKAKRMYIRRSIKNADQFVFPTEYVRDVFCEYYHWPSAKTRIISFYNKDLILSSSSTNRMSADSDSFVYISSALYYKNHKRLLDAWEILYKKNRAPQLSLVVSSSDQNYSTLYQYYDQRTEGFKKRVSWIDTRGEYEYSDILQLQSQHTYTIFPSLAETFGFGTVEGAILGNKVLCSDRPFFEDVIKPSDTFDPLSAQSIADSVKRALTQELPPTELRFHDHVDKLVDLLIAE